MVTRVEVGRRRRMVAAACYAAVVGAAALLVGWALPPTLRFLSNAPVGATDGHLIVVRGFTQEGDLVVNDPAADPRKEQKIQRVYKRAEIAKTWLGRADGVAYLVAPRAAK